MKKIIPALLIAGLLSGCEGYRHADGTVLDHDTAQPLDSVLCRTASDEMYTDSLGNFEVQGPFGSCVSGCPDIEVTFSRPGYQPQTITNPEPKVIVYLKRE